MPTSVTFVVVGGDQLQYMSYIVPSVSMSSSVCGQTCRLPLLKEQNSLWWPAWVSRPPKNAILETNAVLASQKKA